MSETAILEAIQNISAPSPNYIRFGDHIQLSYKMNDENQTNFNLNSKGFLLDDLILHQQRGQIHDGIFLVIIPVLKFQNQKNAKFLNEVQNIDQQEKKDYKEKILKEQEENQSRIQRFQGKKLDYGGQFMLQHNLQHLFLSAEYDGNNLRFFFEDIPTMTTIFTIQPFYNLIPDDNSAIYDKQFNFMIEEYLSKEKHYGSKKYLNFKIEYSNNSKSFNFLGFQLNQDTINTMPINFIQSKAFNDKDYKTFLQIGDIITMKGNTKKNITIDKIIKTVKLEKEDKDLSFWEIYSNELEQYQPVTYDTTIRIKNFKTKQFLAIYENQTDVVLQDEDGPNCEFKFRDSRCQIYEQKQIILTCQAQILVSSNLKYQIMFEFDQQKDDFVIKIFDFIETFNSEQLNIYHSNLIYIKKVDYLIRSEIILMENCHNWIKKTRSNVTQYYQNQQQSNYQMSNLVKREWEFTHQYLKSLHGFCFSEDMQIWDILLSEYPNDDRLNKIVANGIVNDIIGLISIIYETDSQIIQKVKQFMDQSEESTIRYIRKDSLNTMIHKIEFEPEGKDFLDSEVGQQFLETLYNVLKSSFNILNILSGKHIKKVRNFIIKNSKNFFKNSRFFLGGELSTTKIISKIVQNSYDIDGMEILEDCLRIIIDQFYGIDYDCSDKLQLFKSLANICINSPIDKTYSQIHQDIIGKILLQENNEIIVPVIPSFQKLEIRLKFKDYQIQNIEICEIYKEKQYEQLGKIIKEQMILYHELCKDRNHVNIYHIRKQFPSNLLLYYITNTDINSKIKGIFLDLYLVLYIDCLPHLRQDFIIKTVQISGKKDNEKENKEKDNSMIPLLQIPQQDLFQENQETNFENIQQFQKEIKTIKNIIKFQLISQTVQNSNFIHKKQINPISVNSIDTPNIPLQKILSMLKYYFICGLLDFQEILNVLMDFIFSKFSEKPKLRFRDILKKHKEDVKQEKQNEIDIRIQLLEIIQLHIIKRRQIMLDYYLNDVYKKITLQKITIDQAINELIASFDQHLEINNQYKFKDFKLSNEEFYRLLFNYFNSSHCTSANIQRHLITILQDLDQQKTINLEIMVKSQFLTDLFDTTHIFYLNQQIQFLCEFSCVWLKDQQDTNRNKFLNTCQQLIASLQQHSDNVIVLNQHQKVYNSLKTHNILLKLLKNNYKFFIDFQEQDKNDEVIRQVFLTLSALAQKFNDTQNEILQHMDILRHYNYFKNLGQFEFIDCLFYNNFEGKQEYVNKQFIKSFVFSKTRTSKQKIFLYYMMQYKKQQYLKNQVLARKYISGNEFLGLQYQEGKILFNNLCPEALKIIRRIYKSQKQSKKLADIIAYKFPVDQVFSYLSQNQDPFQKEKIIILRCFRYILFKSKHYPFTNYLQKSYLKDFFDNESRICQNLISIKSEKDQFLDNNYVLYYVKGLMPFLSCLKKLLYTTDISSQKLLDNNDAINILGDKIEKILIQFNTHELKEQHRQVAFKFIEKFSKKSTIKQVKKEIPSFVDGPDDVQEIFIKKYSDVPEMNLFNLNANLNLFLRKECKERKERYLILILNNIQDNKQLKCFLQKNIEILLLEIEQPILNQKRIQKQILLLYYYLRSIQNNHEQLNIIQDYMFNNRLVEAVQKSFQNKKLIKHKIIFASMCKLTTALMWENKNIKNRFNIKFANDKRYLAYFQKLENVIELEKHELESYSNQHRIHIIMSFFRIKQNCFSATRKPDEFKSVMDLMHTYSFKNPQSRLLNNTYYDASRKMSSIKLHINYLEYILNYIIETDKQQQPTIRTSMYEKRQTMRLFHVIRLQISQLNQPKLIKCLAMIFNIGSKPIQSGQNQDKCNKLIDDYLSYIDIEYKNLIEPKLIEFQYSNNLLDIYTLKIHSFCLFQDMLDNQKKSLLILQAERLINRKNFEELMLISYLQHKSNSNPTNDQDKFLQIFISLSGSVAYQILNLFSNNQIYNDYVIQKYYNRMNPKKKIIDVKSKSLMDILSNQIEMQHANMDDIQNFSAERTGRIEIYMNGYYSEINFYKFETFNYLDQSLKDEFYNQLDRTTLESKHLSLLNAIKFYKRLEIQMQYHKKIQGSALLEFSNTYKYKLTLLIFSLSIFQNAIMLVSNYGTSFDVKTNHQIHILIFGLLLIQLFILILLSIGFAGSQWKYLMYILKEQIKEYDNHQIALKFTGQFISNVQTYYDRILIWIKIILANSNFLYLFLNIILVLLAFFYKYLVAFQLLNIFYLFTKAYNILRAIGACRYEFWNAFLIYTIIFYIFIVILSAFDNQITNNVEQTEQLEIICNDLYQCFSINFDLKGGPIQKLLGQYKRDDEQYTLGILSLYWFLYNIICNNLLYSMCLIAVITQSFGSLRKEYEYLKQDRENICFICGLKRDDINKKMGEFNFDFHIKYQHNLWSYVFYITYLFNKHQFALYQKEIEIQKMIRHKNMKWIPSKKSIYFQE